MQECTFLPGQHVLKHANPSSHIYVVYDGSCSVRDVHDNYVTYTYTYTHTHTHTCTYTYTYTCRCATCTTTT